MVAESQARMSRIENLRNEQSRNEPPIDPPSKITPFHSTMWAQPPVTETPDREVEHSYLTPVARVLQVQPTSGQTPPPIQGASSPFRGPYPAIGRSWYPSTPTPSLFPLPHIPSVTIAPEPERPLQGFRRQTPPHLSNFRFVLDPDFPEILTARGLTPGPRIPIVMALSPRSPRPLPSPPVRSPSQTSLAPSGQPFEECQTPVNPPIHSIQHEGPPWTTYPIRATFGPPPPGSTPHNYAYDQRTCYQFVPPLRSQNELPVPPSGLPNVPSGPLRPPGPPGPPGLTTGFPSNHGGAPYPYYVIQQVAAAPSSGDGNLDAAKPDKFSGKDPRKLRPFITACVMVFDN